jgi:S1-C subfamily serine protease
VVAVVLFSPLGHAHAQEAHSPKTAGILKAVVGIRTTIPMDSRGARSWGPVREGNGIVIDSAGLVLTVRYLIRRGISAEVIDQDGEVVPARILAYDRASNFGLLRAIKPLKAKPIRLGDSSAIKPGAQVLAVSQGGSKGSVTAARVLQRFTFAAENEYMIEDSILTIPAHENFGGAALIGGNGRLLGVGSLIFSVATEQATVPTNMWMPINSLKPILADLIKHGRRQGPGNPWMGIRTVEADGKVVVSRINRGGPAEGAGIEPGDMIVGVAGKRVRSVEEYYRRAWGKGRAGDRIPLDVLRADGDSIGIDRVEVPSIRFEDRRLPTGSY